MTNKKYIRKKIWGFTLVEVLVVMAIIAVLISILLPALTYSRQLAYRISCLNNLKQLGIAVETYVQSYKFYPVCVPEVNEKWSKFLADKTKPAGEMLGVPVSLWPFHQTAGLYNCPILSRAGCDISYCYNWLAGKKYSTGETELASLLPSYLPGTGTEEEETKYHLLTPEQVKMPAAFILLYDLPDRAALEEKDSADLFLYKDIDPDDDPNVCKNVDPVQGFLWDANMAGPHTEGYNILFADGHTKWYKRWSGSSMSRNPQ